MLPCARLFRSRLPKPSIVVVDELKVTEPKTRLMAKALNSLVGNASALILIPEKAYLRAKSFGRRNNIPDAKILLADYLNIRDLLVFDKVVLPLAVTGFDQAHIWNRRRKYEYYFRYSPPSNGD